MGSVAENLNDSKKQLPQGVELVAVSKTKPVEVVLEAYEAGQRAFGENYVQELVGKQPLLPPDIEWHFIGHLQSNKVKMIAPFVHCIHSVDSEKLLTEINKQAAKNERIIRCLLQVHVATEETKFGWDVEELSLFASSFDPASLPNVSIQGIMGMASFSEDENLVRSEFRAIKSCFEGLKRTPLGQSNAFTTISMGMSSDWKWAVEEGSTLIRIGSAIFGSRN